MSKPVLLLVMSKKCGGCLQYKATAFPKIKAKLEKDPRFVFKIVELDDFNPGNIKTIHPEVKNFIRFFPTYVLFTGESFNDHKSKLVGVVNNSGTEDEPKPNNGDEGLHEWISKTISSAPFSKTSMHRTLPGGQMVVPTRGTYSKYRTDLRSRDDMYL